MIQKHKTDKERDLGYTIPDMALDIQEAIETGVVKKTVVNLGQYNMIDDPTKVGKVINNVFDAIDAQSSFNKPSTAQQE